MGSLRGPRARERDGKGAPGSYRPRTASCEPSPRAPGETGPPGILAQRRRRPRPLRAPPEPRPGAKARARRQGERMRKQPTRRPVEGDAAVARLARVPCAAAGGGAVTRHLGQGAGARSQRPPGSRPPPRLRRPRPGESPRPDLTRVPPQPALPTPLSAALTVSPLRRRRGLARLPSRGSRDHRDGSAALAEGQAPEAAGGAARPRPGRPHPGGTGSGDCPGLGSGSSAAAPGRACEAPIREPARVRFLPRELADPAMCRWSRASRFRPLLRVNAPGDARQSQTDVRLCCHLPWGRNTVSRKAIHR